VLCEIRAEQNVHILLNGTSLPPCMVVIDVAEQQLLTGLRRGEQLYSFF
jgi:hypothetical protein